MPVLKPRKEYLKQLKEFNNEPVCRFCDIKKEYIIKSYKNWTLSFCEYPYWKYHTMLIPKSHAIRFHELKQEELIELPFIMEEVENLYKDKEIISEKSLYGTQLLFFWRSRYWEPEKKFVEHLHLHICPEFKNSWDPILDDEAYKIDIELLKNI